jgi:hypothetical protein
LGTARQTDRLTKLAPEGLEEVDELKGVDVCGLDELWVQPRRQEAEQRDEEEAKQLDASTAPPPVILGGRFSSLASVKYEEAPALPTNKSQNLWNDHRHP